MLRRGDRVGAGRVEHEHARAGRGRDVDVVDADPGARDHTQTWRRGQHVARDLGLAAYDESVGVAHGGEERRNVSAVDVDNGRGGGQSVPRAGVDGVADDDRRLFGLVPRVVIQPGGWGRNHSRRLVLCGRYGRR